MILELLFITLGAFGLLILTGLGFVWSVKRGISSRLDFYASQGIKVVEGSKDLLGAMWIRKICARMVENSIKTKGEMMTPHPGVHVLDILSDGKGPSNYLGWLPVPSKRPVHDGAKNPVIATN